MVSANQGQLYLSDEQAQPIFQESFLAHSSKDILCYDAEGWGPLSPIRFDLAPCFLDALLAGLACLGVLAGGITILYLARQKTQVLIGRNWHFRSKLVRCSCKHLRPMLMP